MGIREKLNERPAVGAGIAIVLILLGIGLIVRLIVGGRHSPDLPAKLYYSDDDGATWFMDDPKIAPYTDAAGKTAYRAALYRCGDGKVFVGHLEGYDSQDRSKAEEAAKGGKTAAFLVALASDQPYKNWLVVKRPGDKDWFKRQPGDAASEQQYRAIMDAKCPEGVAGAARLVWPEEKVEPAR